jgi:sigma-E factor negative regulatory protein RseA
MSEQEQMSQLSALFDNELPPAEAELVIRRVLKDPALRARWERYALIGACVRNEPVRVGAGQPDVAERVRLQLAGDGAPAQESAPEAAGVVRRNWALFGRGALGASIAAGVAVLSLVAVRNIDTQPTVLAQQLVAAPPAVIVEPQDLSAVEAPAAPAVRVAAADSPPPSYTTPVDSVQRGSSPLVGYVLAHSEVAAFSGRPLPLSASSGYDITQNAVAIPDAERGAGR